MRVSPVLPASLVSLVLPASSVSLVSTVMRPLSPLSQHSPRLLLQGPRSDRCRLLLPTAHPSLQRPCSANGVRLMSGLCQHVTFGTPFQSNKVNSPASLRSFARSSGSGDRLGLYSFWCPSSALVASGLDLVRHAPRRSPLPYPQRALSTDQRAPPDFPPRLHRGNTLEGRFYICSHGDERTIRH